MRAAVYYGNRDLRIEDVPVPSPGRGEVKLRVAYNGICGTDLHEFYDGPILVPSARPHPRTGTRAPVILGHEFAGEIVDIGDGVEHLEIGDRVAVKPIHRCGECRYCLRGEYNLCQTIALYGCDGPPGGLAEYTVVRAEAAHRIPDTVGLDLAALTEPLAVSYHAVRLAQPAIEETAVVYGSGPIGLGAVLALKAQGVGRVIAVEPSPERARIVRELGADIVIDPDAEDSVQRLLELTDGYGVELSIDAAGVQAAFSSALAGTAKRGRIVLIATYTEQVSFQPTQLVFGERRIIASNTYRGSDFPEVIDALARGVYPTDGWVRKIALDDLVEHGLQALREGQAMKVLVSLGES